MLNLCMIRGHGLHTVEKYFYPPAVTPEPRNIGFGQNLNFVAPKVLLIVMT